MKNIKAPVRKHITLHGRIDAIKDEMRERGYSTSQFVHDGIRYAAELHMEGGEAQFKVTSMDTLEIVYKTLNL